MRQHPSLDCLDHRPWPVPRGPWALRMKWLDLAFLHWPVDPVLLRPHIPAGLEVDTFDGEAWLGVVPFRMAGVAPRLCPEVPGLSAFPELNLRTYVRAEGKPGVWFFSLDVTSRVCVFMARTFFHLPYNHARMQVSESGGEHLYASLAHHGGEDHAFRARYRPEGPELRAARGSVEEWLTERYCLYSASAGGQLFRGHIQHRPWPLQAATVEVEENTLARGLAGVDLSGPPPLVHFARSLDVVAWLLERVPAGR